MAFRIPRRVEWHSKKSKKRPQEVFRNWKILKGDMVYINTGRDKGLTGVIDRVFRKTNQVLVQGRNLVKKHLKKTQSSPGGVITKEAPIHVSNVQLVDPVSGRAVRTKAGYLEDGTKVRISVGKFATGSIIPKPEIRLLRKPREDGGPKNTLKDAVLERTYDAEMKLGCHPSHNFFMMYERVNRPLPRFPDRDPKAPRAYDVFRNLNKEKTRQPYTPSRKERNTAEAAQRAQAAPKM